VKFLRKELLWKTGEKLQITSLKLDENISGLYTGTEVHFIVAGEINSP
jgi:hypothetical protein